MNMYRMQCGGSEGRYKVKAAKTHKKTPAKPFASAMEVQNPRLILRLPGP